MHRYLVGQGYWSYVEGANENQLNQTHADLLAWEQATSHVLYFLASRVHDHMLGYIREGKMAKEGKSQKDICRKKASTPPRVEQHSTKGYVQWQLHLED